MRKMTENNLRDAFAGESQAHMKYLVFAKKAEEEGRPNVAKLFRAIAFAEQVHASNHLYTLEDVGTTEENLQSAMDGENFEVEEMYPAYDAVAKLQGEKGAIKSVHYAIEAEKIHSVMYAEAKEAVKQGKDSDVGDVHVCPVCGYTTTGDMPDRCPVCGASKDEFVTFS